MKKIYLVGLVLSMVSFLRSQTIPNAGFENWTTTQFIVPSPNSWFTLNLLGLSSFTFPVTKSTDKHSGSFAAKCETVSLQFVDTIPAQVFPGLIALGDFDLVTQTGSFGIPFTARPDSMVFWVKSTMIGGDTAMAYVQLSKWNSSLNGQDIIGVGEVSFTETFSSYKRFSVPLQYNSTDTPDSLNIGFLSGNTLGSYIIVDDVSLVYNTSDVKELADDAKSIEIFPNPVNEEISIRVQNDEDVEIVNSLGVRIYSLKLKKGTVTKLQTENYSNGLYFIKSSSGSIVKFIVRH